MAVDSKNLLDIHGLYNVFQEFGMPPVPYAQIFTIWICSNSLGIIPVTVSYYSSKKLQELVPQPILGQRATTHWASKILREIIQIKDRSPLALKRQFLTHCHYLTVYGSAFFTGTLQNPQSSRGSTTKCHIGVNDVGIHIISTQTKSMLQSYKYSEIEWKHVQEYSLLEIHVTRPEGKTGRISPKTVTKIRSKQAGLINFLMVKLAQMHD
ncbi:FERM domain-containing protein 8-like [Haliotis rubra]|uniref:FERM domain-containing protein 8-like n=1 Tax=Haliotis rubra TaxID=36100 RepID=UPI001EE5CB7A|nr:FERM domain-containing protein 8-like [Haliotis rubra]